MQRTELERNVEELKKKTLNTISFLYINLLENNNKQHILEKRQECAKIYYFLFSSK